MEDSDVEKYLKEIFILVDSEYLNFGHHDEDLKKDIRDIIRDVADSIYRNEESNDIKENRECIYFAIRKLKMVHFLINTAEREKTNEQIYKRIVANINKIIKIEKESLKDIKSLYQN